MQKTKISARLISLILTLSILLSMFSIFAFAEETTDDGVSADEMSVAYNRTFSEGWDYDNGIVDALAKGNTVGIAYEYRNSAYNYYLRFSKQNTAVAYAYMDTADYLSKDGKTFIELDVTSGADCSLGQAIRVSVAGDVKTIVEFREDGLRVLGEDLGSAAYGLKWESLAFEFDFDYYTEETLNTAYKVTAYHNGKKIATKVWEYGLGGSGISQIRFMFGDTQESNVGAWYGVDNLRVYSGTDTFTAIPAGNYGLAVDSTLPKNFQLAGDSTDPDGFLRGEPTVDRKEDMGNALVHYNRHYGEGWDLTNGSNLINDAGNNVDIRSERELSGDYNYFFRFRALNTLNGYMQVPIKDYPADSKLFIEFDLKASVNAQLGGVVQARSATDKNMYMASIVDGQLEIFGTRVGYIGSDWVHLIFEFTNELNEDTGLYDCDVYYGKNGHIRYSFKHNDFNGAVATLRFGAAGGGDFDEKRGDWFGMDNLQIYSDTKTPITIPADEYGIGVSATTPPNFDLEGPKQPEAPIDPDASEGEGAGDFTESVDPNRLLVGSQELNRIDYSEDVWVRYNRYYSEGWGFGVGYSSNSGLANGIFSLESEKELDLSYNYYQSFERVSTGNPFYTFSMGSGYPTTGKVYMELDIRAVEGANLGGLIQYRDGGSSNPYMLGLVGGYLVTDFGGENRKLGKLSESEWCHIAIELDYTAADRDPENFSQGQYLIRMWVGDSTYFEYKRSGASLNSFRIGMEAGSATTIGQFWHMDNFSVYAGAGFCDIPDDVCGNAINSASVRDFPIQTSSVSFDTMTEESLFLKIGSEYSLVNGERTPNLKDADGKVVGCPTTVDGKVWVPLDVILNFLSYPIYVHEDGMSFDISTGSQITYITVGRSTALVGSKKINLNAAPAIVTDKLGYEFLGLTVEDIGLLFPDFYIGVDDMNMIVFSKYEQITTGEISEGLRIDIMKKFIFEYLSAEEIYERAAEYTNNFQHPYIRANQAKFDELRDVWLAGTGAIDAEYDETLFTYLKARVSAGVGQYNKYSGASRSLAIGDGGEYEGLNPICYIFDNESASIGLQHSYPASAGYDPIGGRLYPPDEMLLPLAFAYQITRDMRFAHMAYDICHELVDWNHWGPGHFLNTADCAESVAVTYDWCYNAWVELGLDVDKISDGLYYHGTLQGYLVTIGQPDPHDRRGGSGSHYPTMVNNWNAVCTEGMATCSFAIMNYTGFSADTKLEQKDKKPALRAETYGGEVGPKICADLISRNYKTLISAGLEIYAPDGSYEESVGYWAYGANNLFCYAMVLESCLGDDLGIMDTWGIDRTCYSITHMISSDFRAFPYNDGSPGGSGDTSMFAYVAYAVGDDFLRLVRNMHLQGNGSSGGIYDCLFYKPIDQNEKPEMPLQYHHIGIHGYTVRSSWDRGAIFAGLLGGDNDDGHGHIDAGQWIYYNKGIPFIEDMGADGYNTYNYFSNNHMYKTTVEGHSVMMLTSAQDKVPAGQLRSSVSPVIATGDNEFGAFAVVDTSPAYGGSAYMTSCERGMMITNDRNTVIIQDEVTPYGNHSMVWLAHYSTEYITNVEITGNGRIAYLTSKKNSQGENVVLRLAIVSSMPNIGFETGGAYDFLLDATMRPGDSEAMGKQPENDRSNWHKLMIKFENRININVAVVCEVVDPSDPIGTGYSFTPMDDWVPYADTRVKTGGGAVVENVVTRGKANTSDLIGYTERIGDLVSKGEHFEKLSDYYSALTQVTYTVNTVGRPKLEDNAKFLEYLEQYDEYYRMYDKYVTDVNKTAKAIFAITDLLTATKNKAADAEE